MKNHDELNFIYWFSYYNDGFPSVRYRAKYPLNYLKTNYGINYYLVTPGYSIKKIIVFIRAYISALLFRKTNSLIVIQKINSDFIYARLLKFLIKIQNKFTVYDLDDADYLEYPPETILYFIKNCKMVTAGSHELVFDLKHLNTNILLNTSPVPDLKLVKQKKNNILTIGWIGGFGGEHKESLINNFFPALFEIPIPMKLIIM